jgi:aminoglycoside phosphotransferase (APT) family kinase protein
VATPAADVIIDDVLVRQLLDDQVGELAGLPVAVVDNGWDNVIARAGADWMIRLPRRASAVELLRNEIRWLPELAPRLPLAVPVPRYVGEPSELFPYPFSVCRWHPGHAVSERPLSNLFRAAAALTHFMNALHVAAPDDAPTNPYRGVALAERAEAVHTRAEQLGDEIDGRRVLAVWERVSGADRWNGPPTWLHGDLHPSNMLCDGGALTAIIDWGDLCAGDPATDLALLWMLFPPDARMLVRSGCAIDPATWQRAAGWALNLSLAYLTSDGSTSMPSIGRATLRAVLEEFG